MKSFCVKFMLIIVFIKLGNAEPIVFRGDRSDESVSRKTDEMTTPASIGNLEDLFHSYDTIYIHNDPVPTEETFNVEESQTKITEENLLPESPLISLSTKYKKKSDKVLETVQKIIDEFQTGKEPIFSNFDIKQKSNDVEKLANQHSELSFGNPLVRMPKMLHFKKQKYDFDDTIRETLRNLTHLPLQRFSTYFTTKTTRTVPTTQIPIAQRVTTEDNLKEILWEKIKKKAQQSTSQLSVSNQHQQQTGDFNGPVNKVTALAQEVTTSHPPNKIVAQTDDFDADLHRDNQPFNGFRKIYPRSVIAFNKDDSPSIPVVASSANTKNVDKISRAYFTVPIIELDKDFTQKRLKKRDTDFVRNIEEDELNNLENNLEFLSSSTQSTHLVSDEEKYGSKIESPSVIESIQTIADPETRQEFTKDIQPLLEELEEKRFESLATVKLNIFENVAVPSMADINEEIKLLDDFKKIEPIGEMIETEHNKNIDEEIAKSEITTTEVPIIADDTFTTESYEEGKKLENNKIIEDDNPPIITTEKTAKENIDNLKPLEAFIEEIFKTTTMSYYEATTTESQNEDNFVMSSTTDSNYSEKESTTISPDDTVGSDGSATTEVSKYDEKEENFIIDERNAVDDKEYNTENIILTDLTIIPDIEIVTESNSYRFEESPTTPKNHRQPKDDHTVTISDKMDEEVLFNIDEVHGGSYKLTTVEAITQPLLVEDFRDENILIFPSVDITEVKSSAATLGVEESGKTGNDIEISNGGEVLAINDKLEFIIETTTIGTIDTTTHVYEYTEDIEETDNNNTESHDHVPETTTTVFLEEEQVVDVKTDAPVEISTEESSTAVIEEKGNAEISNTTFKTEEEYSHNVTTPSTKYDSEVANENKPIHNLSENSKESSENKGDHKGCSSKEVLNFSHDSSESNQSVKKEKQKENKSQSEESEKISSINHPYSHSNEVDKKENFTKDELIDLLSRPVSEYIKQAIKKVPQSQTYPKKSSSSSSSEKSNGSSEEESHGRANEGRSLTFDTELELLTEKTFKITPDITLQDIIIEEQEVIEKNGHVVTKKGGVSSDTFEAATNNYEGGEITPNYISPIDPNKINERNDKSDDYFTSTTATNSDNSTVMDDVLVTIVDVVEISTEISHSLNSFRDTAKENREISETSNQIVASKNTRDLVGIDMAGHPKDTSRIFIKTEVTDDHQQLASGSRARAKVDGIEKKANLLLIGSSALIAVGAVMAGVIYVIRKRRYYFINLPL